MAEDAETERPAAEPAPNPRTAARGREVNTIELAPERTRKGRKSEEPAREERSSETPPAGQAPTRAGSRPSLQAGDVPDAIKRRYFTEAGRFGGAMAFYEGPGAKRPAFHDHGGRLSTDQTHPDIVRDFADIASHRGWTTIRVRGEDEFRRQVWLEARARGLEVRGYKPRERDEQELQQRLAQAERRAARPSPREAAAGRVADRTPEASRDGAERAAGTARVDLDAGIAGVLLESGEAPYRRRSGEPLTPFIRLDRGEGRPLDIWGVGLPEALARSGAGVGDRIQVRRDGVDLVQKELDVRDPRTGETARQLRDVPRNRWRIEAERFRTATAGEAARDPDLRGAQTHLAVVDAVIDRAVKDPERRDRLRAEAREMVGDELAQGRRFEPARIRDVEPVLARDIAEAARRPERARVR